MKVKEIYPDVINGNMNYEFKAVLNPDSPVKWAKTFVAYDNGEGGTMFVGVGDDGEAFGLDLDSIDRAKRLITLVNDRHIFPHVKVRYMMRSVDEKAERFVLAVQISSAESIVRYREGDFNETVYVKGDGCSSPLHRRRSYLLEKGNSG